jgi:hypothetical protein
MTLPLPRRQHRETLGPRALEWLASHGTTLFWYLDLGVDPEQARKFLDLHRDDFLIQWARDYPGSRPPLWWKYEAPEPRKRLGGTGTPDRWITGADLGKAGILGNAVEC